LTTRGKFQIKKGLSELTHVTFGHHSLLIMHSETRFRLVSQYIYIKLYDKSPSIL